MAIELNPNIMGGRMEEVIKFLTNDTLDAFTKMPKQDPDCPSRGTLFNWRKRDDLTRGDLEQLIGELPGIAEYYTYILENDQSNKPEPKSVKSIKKKELDYLEKLTTIQAMAIQLLEEKVGRYRDENAELRREIEELREKSNNLHFSK